VRVNFDFGVFVMCVGGFMVHHCACVCAELLVLFSSSKLEPVSV
jgi:hypothetical protein